MPESSPPIQAFTARHVATMRSAAVIPSGIVVIQGTVIEGVYSPSDYPSHLPKPTDLGSMLLMPGLVNAHTHLELSNTPSLPKPPGDFVDWVLSLSDRTNRHREDYPDRLSQATKDGIAQSLRFGVTTVGDISQTVDITRPILQQSPIRAISYGEALGAGTRRARFDPLFLSAIKQHNASTHLTVGVSPHAPYSLHPDDIRKCVLTGLPLCIHLSETADEKNWLNHHTGRFADLYHTIGIWTNDWPTFPGTPVQYAKSLGLLDANALLAHVNYCNDADIQLLAGGNGTVVYCPRTHAYFGHPPHRFQDMIQAGIPVAIGTDSCASSPDLNLLKDIQLIHTLAPQISAYDLLKMITIIPAKAMQLPAGELIAGKNADIIALPIHTENPLQEIIETTPLPTHIWIAGQQV